MSEQSELTLKQLAQLALGLHRNTSELDNSNISILYSLIDIILTKLNCKDEKVTLAGEAGKSLQKLLLDQSCSGPSLIFDDNKIKKPLEKFENLAELEQKVEAMESSLNEHLSSAEDHKKKFDKVMNRVVCTAFCDASEPTDELSHGLSKNNFFLTQLQDFITTSIRCNLMRLDKKISIFSQEIGEFTGKSSDSHNRMNVLEELWLSFLEIKKSTNDLDENVLITMKEVQETMDNKVNNKDMLEVKHEIYKHIENLEKKVNDFIDEQTRPRALVGYMEILNTSKNVCKVAPKKGICESKKHFHCGCDWTLWSQHFALSKRIETLDTHALMRLSTFTDFERRVSISNNVKI